MPKSKVATPIAIGRMILANRIVMAPTIHEMCYHGHPTDAYVAITATYAKSGVSMVCIGGATVDPEATGDVFPNALSIADDEDVFGLQRLAEVIRANGARSCQQIYHPGRGAARYWAQTSPEFRPWAASSHVPFMLAPKWEIGKDGGAWRAARVVNPAPTREITLDEIEQVVRMHAMAVLRAKKAGFDAVNLHFANVTLVMDFMSPYTNARTDAYGGDWERRMRLPCEIVQAARAAAGKGYPLIVRVPADQGLGEAGIRIGDVVEQIVPRLEAAGADAIDLSAGILDHTPHRVIPPMYDARGCWLHYAEAVKKVARVPVIVAGRLCDPRMIVKALEDGRCDVAAVSRPLMADPLMPRKMLAGRAEEVRMCVACGYCMTEAGWGKFCAVNAESARELILPKIEAANPPRRVLVAGGGPAGMEAARVLRERGHDVTLCEGADRLGGALRIASASPLTREWRTFTAWHVRQLERLGVQIRLNTEVTRELADRLKPDIVVVATGSVPNREIPGCDLPVVVTEDDALVDGAAVGKRVVVLGGAFWDVETAISLADRGKDVTLVRADESIALWELGLIKAMPILTGMLPQKNIRPLFRRTAESIGENGVTVVDAEGNREFLEADAVVLSAGRSPDRTLADALRDGPWELHVIGDCAGGRGVADAVYDGRVVGARI